MSACSSSLVSVCIICPMILRLFRILLTKIYTTYMNKTNYLELKFSLIISRSYFNLIYNITFFDFSLTFLYKID